MTYDLWHQPPERERLAKLLGRVLDVMRDGRFRTFAEIQAVTGGTETSISARLRELRANGFTVEKRERSRGLWEYRLTGKQEQAA